MTVQQIEQKYQGLQIVPCNVKSEVGTAKVYLLLFPAQNLKETDVNRVLDAAVLDLMGDHSFHQFVPFEKDDYFTRVIFTDGYNSLIPPQLVATITQL